MPRISLRDSLSGDYLFISHVHNRHVRFCWLLDGRDKMNHRSWLNFRPDFSSDFFAYPALRRCTVVAAVFRESRLFHRRKETLYVPDATMVRSKLHLETRGIERSFVDRSSWLE